LKIYSAIEDKYEAKIINISVNDIIDYENTEKNYLNNNNYNKNNNDETNRNLIYSATEYSNISNLLEQTAKYTEIKRISTATKGDLYCLSIDSNENGNKNFIKNSNKSQEENSSNFLNGVSYINFAKSDNNITFIKNKTESNKSENEPSNSNQKHNYNNFIKIKNLDSSRNLVSSKLKDKNKCKKIREKKQEENLFGIIDNSKENKSKQNKIQINKLNNHLHRIKINKINEIYKIISGNFDNIHTLTEFGLSDYVIENLVFPFFSFIDKKELSFNFQNFQAFAYQKIDEFSKSFN
jgi:hypothetical protein